MASDFCVVMTTADSAQLADRIATALLDARLAACIQVMPMTSHYVWDGAVRREAESLLLIKAKSADYPAIAEKIRLNHSYETPEIIRLDIADGDPAYLGWIASVTR